MNFRNILLLLLTLTIGCTNRIEKSKADENLTSENAVIDNSKIDSLKYLKQKPPSLIPEVFAPGLISSKSNQEFGSDFSKDGKEFFYTVNVNSKTEIRYTKLAGDQWIEPKILLTDETYGFDDPFLSPDEKRLYFISQRSEDGSYKKGTSDIWYIEKSPAGWSVPINAGPNINTKGNEFYTSFTSDGSLYFTSDLDIYASKLIGGIYQKAVAIESLNSPYYEGDVFIAPDEAYVIFNSKRPGGLGGTDLYICFKEQDGSWGQPKNMGESINSAEYEFCPNVSKDGKYFFFSSKGDIYWVNAKIIEQYKH